MSKYNFEQANRGRAIEFKIHGNSEAVNAELLAEELYLVMQCQFELKTSMKNHVYGFHGRYGELVVIDGDEWTDYFRIITGVSHNLYDSYAHEYSDAISKIREVLNK